MQADSLIANRYRIERRIARGGQASVYLARQVPLDRKVALKVLTPPPGSDDNEIRTFQERFLLEARTLATLDHPNIVTVYDYGQIEPGCFYIAMEFVEGRRFSALLREGPMDPERTLRLIGQVCSALRYAHQRKVIHRDIKNSNVLVRVDHHGNEQVKVVDFGIAKLMEDDASLTMTGVVMGSPHFMAPEQARGSNIDHRVDIYAVGVLMYCGLVGRYPFNGTSSREIVSAHLSQDIPTFGEVNPELQLHPHLEGCVRRCLAKEPAERFQDVDTLITALTPFLGDADSMVMPAFSQELPAGAAPARPKWMGLLLAGAVAVALLPALILAAILVVLIARTPSPPPIAEQPAVTQPAAVQPVSVEPTTPPVETTFDEPAAPPEPAELARPVEAVQPVTASQPATTAPTTPPASAPTIRPRTAPAPPPAAADPTPASVNEPAPEPVETAPAPAPADDPAPEWPDAGGDDGFQIGDNDLRNPWED